MVSSLPITFRKSINCAQCGHACPRLHFTRKCWVGDHEVALHLCSRYCVNSLHTIRCYGCRTLGLTLYKVSKYRRFCLPDHQQTRSCLALLCTPEPWPEWEEYPKIRSSASGYGSMLMSY